MTAVFGRLGDDTYDPFERLGDELLLAEGFARLDLEAPEPLLGWFERHGVLDLAHVLPSETRVAPLPFAEVYRDDLTAIAEQRANVAWHLLAIARLSDHLVPQPGQTVGVPWQESWAQPVLANGDGHYWAGGEGWARQLLPGMRRSSKPRGTPPGFVDDEEWRTWWAEGHAAWRRIESERVPVVRVVSDVGASPEGAQPVTREIVAGQLVDGLGTDPWDLIALEVRLMKPYLTMAGEHRVEVGWPALDVGEGPEHRPIEVREVRTWDSILAPIYLQLFEGLRRVTEGLRGAAFCRECGQPFLTLDARRSAFCTEREKSRHGQREHRRRQARLAEHREELEGIDLPDPDELDDAPVPDL
jgi:hypothetical protein